MAMMRRTPIRCQDEGHEFSCRMARKTCWTCTGAPEQRQDSTTDQLKDLLVLARAHGMYDACDWIMNNWLTKDWR